LKPPKRLLVVEDDGELRATLSKLLQEGGYEVVGVADGRSAKQALERNDCDLALIDLVLPDMNGLALVRSIRESGQRLPIIVVTARAALADRVVGLDTGADDYVVKPFQMRELEARIRALLREPPESATAELRVGPLLLVPGEARIWIDGTAMELPAGELALLQALASRGGQPVSREMISRRLQNRRGPASDTAIDLCVFRLRRRLGTHGVEIRSLRGFGYILTTVDTKRPG
jgi:DNA-binding response OmpR family regulator